MKKTLNVIAIIATTLLVGGAIAGAAMGCVHALILLAPAALAAIYPIINLVKSIKLRLATNR